MHRTWNVQHVHRRRRATALIGALVAVVAVAPARAQADREAGPLTFGLYAGSEAGTPSGLAVGPPDEPAQIQPALDKLQGDRDRPFLVRAFTAFVDQPAGTISGTTPADVGQYAVHGRKIDLVLGYASTVDSLTGWTRYVADMVHAYGHSLGAIQVTEEPNLLIPGGPNGQERSRQAVVAGVLAADGQLRRDGLRRIVDVGMSYYAAGDPEPAFWQDIGRSGGPRFRAALDYVGVDLYPGVLTSGGVADGVVSILQTVREQSMPLAGLGRRVPIHVSENGWPTGPGRADADQAKGIEDAIRTVSATRAQFHVTDYELFDLRDADTTVANPWYHFGILRSDYTPKPAFDVYRRLIGELGARHTARG